MTVNLPIGTIIAWGNETIPTGWAVCDGTGGTPNLIGKFIRGAAEDGDVGTTGGADIHSHTNPNTADRAAHNHGGSVAGICGGPSGGEYANAGTQITVASPSHTHSGSISITSANLHSHTLGATNTSSSLPLHIKRVFIRRMS